MIRRARDDEKQNRFESYYDILEFWLSTEGRPRTQGRSPPRQAPLVLMKNKLLTKTMGGNRWLFSEALRRAALRLPRSQ
jgi:hypothetical protein